MDSRLYSWRPFSAGMCDVCNVQKYMHAGLTHDNVLCDHHVHCSVSSIVMGVFLEVYYIDPKIAEYYS